MKVSEITADEIASYLRLEEGEYTEPELSVLLDAAKAFARSYTGLDDATIDTHPDITPVIYILCQDMYDNRAMYVDKSNVNCIVDTILGMYCVNLLPSSDGDGQ